MINGVTRWIILQFLAHEPHRELSVIIRNAGFSFFFSAWNMSGQILTRARILADEAQVKRQSLNFPPFAQTFSSSVLLICSSHLKTAAPFWKMWWKSDKCANLCPLRCSLWMRWGKVTHFMMKPLWNWSNYSGGGAGGGGRGSQWKFVETEWRSPFFPPLQTSAWVMFPALSLGQRTS